MLWWALGLAVLAAVAAVVAYVARARRRDLVALETTTAAELRALHEAATQAAGQDAFGQLVELKGTAGAHVDGLLTSELTGTACVWYRQRVTRKYEEVRRDSDGNRTVTESEDVVSENCSTQAFFLVDGTGRVPVVPETPVKSARKVLDEFRPADRRDSGTRLEFGSFRLSLPGGSGGTLGYRYEEWVLTERTPLYVRGEAVDRAGRLSVRKPRTGASQLITTKSEEEMVAGAERTFLVSAGTAALLALGAGAALVAGLVG